MSAESTENITTLGNTFVLTLIDTIPLPVVKCHRNCLIWSNTYAFRKVIKLYISYTLNKWFGDINTGFKLDNCFFAFVKLSENADHDKYPYRGFGIRFNARWYFSLPGIILELMIALLCILIIKTKTSEFLVKVQHKD